jgi:hypothetical protein
VSGLEAVPDGGDVEQQWIDAGVTLAADHVVSVHS